MDLNDLQALAIATAIGFIIGFERDWRREEEQRERSFAGARTFALTGLVGGLAALASIPFVVPAGFIVLGAISIAAYWAKARAEPDTGGTTEIALLAAYLLGVTAAEEPVLAAIGGAATTILLALKPLTTRAAGAMDARELKAALRFLAISVIVLPILPDKGYGPYDALNPRNIWWMVVLISGLSFLGYWLTKLQGSRGILLTGIVGGLASSTATTLSLSRLVRDGTTSARAGAAGIIGANVVMLARVGVLLFAVSQTVLAAVWPALAAGAVAGGVVAILLWRGDREKGSEMKLGNPMELGPALIFAALIAFISVASHFATETFGDSGLYALAFFTGLADVDAITLTAGQQAGSGGIGVTVAGAAVLIAVAANTLVKVGMTLSIAGRGAGLWVGGACAAIVAAGAAGFLAASAF
ncbi:MAG: MgtC/SapB family protein [Amphiplicatus sp.]